MCGLYGFCGKPTKDTTTIIRQLGILNASRGTDSTGIALVARDKFALYKNAVASPDFFQDIKLWDYLVEFRKKPFVIIQGHTRMATRGAVTSANAHPFLDTNYIFSHNGVINNFDELLKEHETQREVDSEIIGVLLNKKETLPDVFKELSGMFAAPIVDVREPDRLHVGIHAQWFAFAKRNDQLYYSSSMAHLKEALKDEKDFTFTETESNNLYSFYPVNGEIAISKVAIQAKPYAVSYYFKDNDWNGYNWWHKDKRQESKEVQKKRLEGIRHCVLTGENYFKLCLQGTHENDALECHDFKTVWIDDKRRDKWLKLLARETKKQKEELKREKTIYKRQEKSLALPLR